MIQGLWVCPMGQTQSPWKRSKNGFISVGFKNPTLMTIKDLNHWIMYHEIHKLSRLGFSAAHIARYLVMDARTVGRYLGMSEQEYELYRNGLTHRNKVLSDYEPFVKQKLTEFQDTSTAQIHDWLKEYYPDFPQVSPRTVFNFVMYVRQLYNIPVVKPVREYFPIPELPYGEQAQVDFGEYNLRKTDGSRQRVKFFVMVMAHSRMKYIWFQSKPFTAQSVCQAHENAFAFFDGIPNTIVYDQDRTMVVDENIGDIILTKDFKQYADSRSFALHFCRKADPESKGKVENVVQYVKKNFLYNRAYSDLESLNQQALAWLARTANFLPHNYTKKSPESEFAIEKLSLNHYAPIRLNEIKNNTYAVRKTNTISYKSNFYTLPMGTYQGPGTQVEAKENENILELYNLNGILICTHPISLQKGQTISNTNHRRDTSLSLKEMITETSKYFTDEELGLTYIWQIKAKYPRYTRDHLQVMLKTLKQADQATADKSLEFCIKNELYNGHEFEQVFFVQLSQTDSPFNPHNIKLFNNGSQQKAIQSPQTSSMLDYEHIINH
jgi:transposase